jgi:hypothetical protein
MKPYIQKMLRAAHIDIVLFEQENHPSYFKQPVEIIRQQIYRGQSVSMIHELYDENTCLIAIDSYSKILLGVIIYSVNEKNKAEILVLAKSHLTGHHRHGIGTLLLMSAYAELEERDVTLVKLQSAPSAINFYKKKVGMRAVQSEHRSNFFKDRVQFTDKKRRLVTRSAYSTYYQYYKVNLLINEKDPIHGLYAATLTYYIDGQPKERLALIANLPSALKQAGASAFQAYLYSPQFLYDEDPNLVFIGVYFSHQDVAALKIQNAYYKYRYRKKYGYLTETAAANYITYMEENF